MSIQTQIDRISESVSAALTALTEKGVTVPDGTKVDGLAALISAIESGGGGADISEADQWLIDFWHQRTSFAYAFYNQSIENIPLIDTSNGTSFTYMFYQCSSLTEIPLIDTSNGTNFSYMFYGCSKLTTIPQLDVSSGTSFSSMFNRCSSLMTISFVEGCIKRAISFASCSLLSDESVQSIIDGLADLTGGTSQKVTFHPDISGKLTEEQKQQVLNKNWAIG